MCWIGAIGSQSWTVAWPFIAMWLVFKLAFWAVIVTLVVCAIRRLRRNGCHLSPMTPLEILKARYARGEISKQDFESMRQDVER